MIVLGLDFETTGLEPTKDRVIEIGAVLWDTDGGIPLRIYSELCWSDDMPEINAEAASAHGLTPEVLNQYGRSHIYALGEMNAMTPHISAFVAHNGIQFDKPFYEAEMNRLSMPICSVPWIDTCTDLKYPASITTRKLTHLAAEHGFINPFAHRAVFDVLTMLKIFQLYDPVKALAYAQEPMLTLMALVSYDDREKAKARGYRWKSDTRQWLKSFRASDATVEQSSAGFKVVEVKL